MHIWKIKLSSDFGFLTRDKLLSTNTSDLQKAAIDLALKYSDLNPAEIYVK